MRVGAHESIAGGLATALERALDHQAEALQIFTSNATRWAPTPRSPEEVAGFRRAAAAAGLPLLAHGSYLVNLASGATDLQQRSRAAFLAEVERCEALGVDGLVIHPGAHGGAGAVRGLALAAAAIRRALDRTRGFRVRVLLELTAGQGTALGATFGELGALLEAIGRPERTGLCIDTCHAFAAGHDLRGAYEAVWQQLDHAVGLEHVRAFHLNDSRGALGARVDRHAGIGEGLLGPGPFARLLADPRFADLPGVVELPPAEVPASLRKLKSLRRRAYTATKKAGR